MIKFEKMFNNQTTKEIKSTSSNVGDEVIPVLTDVLNTQFSPIFASIILIVTLFLSRFLILRYWKNLVKLTVVERRKIASVSRGILLGFLILGMLMIWAPELHAFALSIAAFAVALVVGTKELIMAALGGIYRLLSRAYRVGDWIRVGEFRGEVVDFTLTSTTLEKLGPFTDGSRYTGDKIIFPNSRLLTDPVINENDYGYFVLRNISIPFDENTDLKKTQMTLGESFKRQVDLNSKEASKFINRMSEYLDFNLTDMQPTFKIEMTDTKVGKLIMSAFIPTTDLESIEFEIINSYRNKMLQKGSDLTETETNEKSR